MIDPRTQRAGNKSGRFVKDHLFVVVCLLAAGSCIAVLGVLLASIIIQGTEHLDTALLTGVPSRKAEKAGIFPAMIGTIYICLVCAFTAIPLGVGTAILLEEFKPRRPFLARLHGFVQLNITNLAGVPSIVYGILGLTAFVSFFGIAKSSTNEPILEFGIAFYDEFYDMTGEYVAVPVSGREAPTVELHEGLVGRWGPDHERVELKVVEDQAQWRELEQQLDAVLAAVDESEDQDQYEAARLEAARPFAGYVRAGDVPSRTDDEAPWYLVLPFGRGVLAGGLTLMLVVLPIVIISSQEALRAVPDSLRHGALALGATRWQMVWNTTLPSAVPGIMTGTILAMSRAIGEAAPILIIAGIVYITFIPAHLMDDFTAMPLQIYDWAGRPQEAFHGVAASGIIVLMAILLTFNATAVIIRQKFQRTY